MRDNTYEDKTNIEYKIIYSAKKSKKLPANSVIIKKKIVKKRGDKLCRYKLIKTDADGKRVTEGYLTPHKSLSALFKGLHKQDTLKDIENLNAIEIIETCLLSVENEKTYNIQISTEKQHSVSGKNDNSEFTNVFPAAKETYVECNEMQEVNTLIPIKKKKKKKNKKAIVKIEERLNLPKIDNKEVKEIKQVESEKEVPQNKNLHFLIKNRKHEDNKKTKNECKKLAQYVLLSSTEDSKDLPKNSIILKRKRRKDSDIDEYKLIITDNEGARLLSHRISGVYLKDVETFYPEISKQYEWQGYTDTGNIITDPNSISCINHIIPHAECDAFLKDGYIYSGIKRYTLKKLKEILINKKKPEQEINSILNNDVLYISDKQTIEETKICYLVIDSDNCDSISYKDIFDYVVRSHRNLSHNNLDQVIILSPKMDTLEKTVINKYGQSVKREIKHCTLDFLNQKIQQEYLSTFDTSSLGIPVVYGNPMELLNKTNISGSGFESDRLDPEWYPNLNNNDNYKNEIPDEKDEKLDIEQEISKEDSSKNAIQLKDELLSPTEKIKAIKNKITREEWNVGCGGDKIVLPQQKNSSFFKLNYTKKVPKHLAKIYQQIKESEQSDSMDDRKCLESVLKIVGKALKAKSPYRHKETQKYYEELEASLLEIVDENKRAETIYIKLVEN